MPNGFLLSRVLLQFGTGAQDVITQLSAATFTPDGSLWVGSDELRSIERFSSVAPYVYGERKSFQLRDFVTLLNDEDEVDIEGMDYAAGYLYFTGSHSLKRKKPKGKGVKKDAARLGDVVREANRYLLGRIPVMEGELFKSYAHPEYSAESVRAGVLETLGEGNVLTEALKDDPHLGPFLSFPLPGKDNGFNIEGLAVSEGRVFLGFRGPVLRGMAIILEISLAAEGEVLTLEPIGKGGAPYRKHFVDLRGLGVRDLCFCGNNLIILAGPTVELEGAMAVFCWRDALASEEESFVYQSEGLDLLFDLPFTLGSDHAEGLAGTSCLGQDALLVVYDDPDRSRFVGEAAVFADAFRL